MDAFIMKNISAHIFEPSLHCFVYIQQEKEKARIKVSEWGIHKLFYTLIHFALI